ncbi:MAG: hypothetical protein UR87_C0038G0003 [candidate division CPR3 bacterium GW2011_GWE2_35_7]|nr:MAG: hypothetical protein UR87_C0038G0003 [candidate division CPR3 bacterium GW2011_GWE2_35_7]
MKKKLLKLFPFLVIIATFLSLSQPLFSPALIEANPPADVFTGQIIPAFIGNEYDPSVAFQELAGSTVYVFAYDNWEAASDRIVVGNKAIKTQIRADGSFQVMGLPHASYYGVYFPYDQYGPYEPRNGSGTEYSYSCSFPSPPLGSCDAIWGGNAPVYPIPGLDDYCCVPPTRVANTIKNTPFRAPEPDDNIIDVFSYAQAIYNGTSLIPTQIADEFIKPEGKAIFVTSNNKLDIENHINVFPVVPTSVLKIKIDTEQYGNSIENSDRSQLKLGYAIAHRPVSVTATRIGYYRIEMCTNIFGIPWDCGIDYGTKYLPIGGPAITGRTDENGNFKAYAPSGYYHIKYVFEDGTENMAFREIDALGENPEPADSNFGVTTALLKSLSQWKTDPTDTYIEDKPQNVIDPPLYKVYRKGVSIWGSVTRPFVVKDNNRSQFNIPVSTFYTGNDGSDTGGQSNTMPDLAVYTETNYSAIDLGVEVKQDFEAVNMFNNSGVISADHDDNYCVTNKNACNFSTVNKYGIFYMRTSEAYSFINGKIRLAGYNSATNEVFLDSLPLYPDVGSTDYIEPQPQALQGLISGPNSSYSYNFSTKKHDNRGIYATVRDNRGLAVPGAQVTIAPNEPDLKSSSVAQTQGISLLTDADGSVYLSPHVFSENAELMTDSATCKDTFKASLDLTKDQICDSIDAQQSVEIASIKGKNVYTNEPGMIQLAKALQTDNIFTVSAAETESACQIYKQDSRTVAPYVPNDPVANEQECVNLYGYFLCTPDPFVTIQGEFFGGVSENVIVLAAGDASGSYRSTEIIKEEVIPNPETTLHSSSGFGGFYDTTNKKLYIHIPCAWKSAQLKIEAGEEKTDNSQGDVELTVIEQIRVYLIQFGANLAKGFAGARDAVDIGGSFDYDEAVEEIDEVAESGIDSIINKGLSERHFIKGDARKDEMQVAISETNVSGTPPSYTINPPAATFFLKPACHVFDLLNYQTWGNFACNLIEGMGKFLQGSMEFLEDTILHTKPISELSTITTLWNLSRNISNGIIIILVLIFAVMYMFRMDSKDLPLKELPMKIVKAVILINLSLLFCQLFIDISNVATRSIFLMVQNAFSPTGQTAVINFASFAAIITTIALSAGASGVTAGVGIATAVVASGGTALVAIGIGVIVAVLAFFMAIITLAVIILIQFVVRLMVIYLCVILAPLRFLMGILPQGESFVKIWDTTFYSFVFMQVLAALFLNVGIALMSNIPSGAGLEIVISQLAVGVAIFMVALKSPSLILQLLGGGGMAGKLAGGAGETLTEWRQGQQEKMGAEAVAGRAGEFKAESQMHGGGVRGFGKATLSRVPIISTYTKAKNANTQAQANRLFTMKRNQDIQKEGQGSVLAQGTKGQSGDLTHIEQTEGGNGVLRSVNAWGSGRNDLSAEIDTNRSPTANQYVQDHNRDIENDQEVKDIDQQANTEQTQQIEAIIRPDVETQVNNEINASSPTLSLDDASVTQAAQSRINMGGAAGKTIDQVKEDVRRERTAARAPMMAAKMKEQPRIDQAMASHQAEIQKIKDEANKKKMEARKKKGYIVTDPNTGTAKVNGQQLLEIAEQELKNDPKLKKEVERQIKAAGLAKTVNAKALHAAKLAEGTEGGVEVGTRQQRNIQNRRRQAGAGQRVNYAAAGMNYRTGDLSGLNEPEENI